MAADWLQAIRGSHLVDCAFQVFKVNLGSIMSADLHQEIEDNFPNLDMEEIQVNQSPRPGHLQGEPIPFGVPFKRAP